MRAYNSRRYAAYEASRSCSRRLSSGSSSFTRIRCVTSRIQPERWAVVRITRVEALDVLRKWFTEESLVRCEAGLSTLAFSIVGRIIKLDEREIKILSLDKFHEAAILFTEKMEFGYGDFRDLAEEGKHYDSSIVAFPDGPLAPQGEPDTIAFAVIKHTE